MGYGRRDSRADTVGKARSELGSLAARGVLMAGNAFSQVTLLKGEPSEAERDGAPLLSGDDGKALRAALQALGYAPQDWAGLATWDESGIPLAPDLLREALCTLDPVTVVVCDDEAARVMRDVYADDLVELERLDEAMLTPGTCVRIAGMRVMNLGGFAAALADGKRKQVMWRYLKQLPPLGEPY